MKKCIVIGGGFAGLSAAAYLAGSKIQVDVLEAAQKLGGRAYSLIDKESQTIIDNGQHILMGCYNNTLNFFDLIDAKENLVFQKKLEINFLKKNFNLLPLKASSAPYPLNLLIGLMNYRAISFNERLLLLKFFLKIYLYSDEELKKLSVYQWLILEKQNENIRKAFWEILAVGALNTNIKKASAKTFSDILKEIFFKGNFAATIILPKKGLTETYCCNAEKLIKEKGGEICLSEQVLEIVHNGNEISEIRTNRRSIKDFKFVISALPLYALEKIIDPKNIFPKELSLDYSTILSIHIWLKENKLKKTFYGLIDSKIHWIFNHGTHITIVKSDANEYDEKDKDEIFEIVVNELKLYAGIQKEDITAYKIIKEKRSTFVPSNDIIGKRPGAKTKIKNLFLAGDWIDTGLPSTIESAVKSGRIAAEASMGNEGF